jgi:transcriptional regulator with GAF, ATPase, and Fis domain
MPLRIGNTVIRFEHGSGSIEIDLSRREQFYDLVGHGVRMREIFAVLEKGETGTGKELVARAIHRASKRSQRPLVVQDCSAIPANLIESILFGHERGSFTGAADRKRGCFEVADGGTLFLDEIGELDISLQPNLLRVLETREVQRVGGTRMIPVDVRVVAATNRDLRQMVNEGTFREDLYYRLSVVQVDLPPLRERTEDIPELARQFLEESSKRGHHGEGEHFTITRDAMHKLQAYPWPGNVRELKNTIERAVSLADQTELGMHDLLPASQKTPPVVFPGDRRSSMRSKRSTSKPCSTSTATTSAEAPARLASLATTCASSPNAMVYGAKPTPPTTKIEPLRAWPPIIEAMGGVAFLLIVAVAFAWPQPVAAETVTVQTAALGLNRSPRRQ